MYRFMQKLCAKVLIIVNLIFRGGRLMKRDEQHEIDDHEIVEEYVRKIRTNKMLITTIRKLVKINSFLTRSKFSLFIINHKYNLLSIVFIIITMGLICFTLPLLKEDTDEFFNISRTLLLAIGGGFFGLLGFIVGAFAISSNKMPSRRSWDDSMLNRLVPIDDDLKQDLEQTRFIFEIERNVDYLKAYIMTIKLIIFNIIATFLIFIITCIPIKFNLFWFWVCTSIVVTLFYAAIFSTLKLLEVGLEPLFKEREQLKKAKPIKQIS